MHAKSSNLKDASKKREKGNCLLAEVSIDNREQSMGRSDTNTRMLPRAF